MFKKQHYFKTGVIKLLAQSNILTYFHFYHFYRYRSAMLGGSETPDIYVKAFFLSALVHLMQQDENVLHNKIKEFDFKKKVWEVMFNNSGVSEENLMKPGLIMKFDKARNIRYFGDVGRYWITNPITGITKLQDFILHSGTNEVTVVELKVCYYDYFVKYGGYYSYCVENPHASMAPQPYESEKVIEVQEHYSIVVCINSDELEKRADKQACGNAVLLKNLQSVTLENGVVVPPVDVSYCSITAVWDKNCKQWKDLKYLKTNRKKI